MVDTQNSHVLQSNDSVTRESYSETQYCGLFSLILDWHRRILKISALCCLGRLQKLFWYHNEDKFDNNYPKYSKDSEILICITVHLKRSKCLKFHISANSRAISKMFIGQ